MNYLLSKLSFVDKHPLVSVIILLTLAFLLRFYQIDQIPPSLYYDEVDYGYQARSLIETGKDYLGFFSPFYVRSFNDIRAPLPAYLTVITTLLFHNPYLQVRMPSVVMGTLSVVLIYLIMRIWTKNNKLAFIGGLVFATSPWMIQFSRFSHEVATMTGVYLLGIYLFYLAIYRYKYLFLLLSTVVLSLSVYTYRTMSLFAPLTLILLFIFYQKELKKFSLKKLFTLPIIAFFLIGSFLYATTIAAPDLPRIAQLSITSDPETSIWVQLNREVDMRSRTDPADIQPPSLIAQIFHNKPISWIDAFINNYFKNFSTDFLFIKGDPNHRHSAGQMGELLLIDILPLLFGLYYLGKNFNNKKEFRWLVVWLLVAPIPASLTMDGAFHASRLILLAPPLLIVVSIGWWYLLTLIKRFKYPLAVIFLLGGFWMVLFVNYLHRYFIHYPIESGRYFGYGYQQAVEGIVKNDANFNKIMMYSTYDPPMIYYLFWSNTNPKYLQEYGTNFSENIYLGKKLDKYKVTGRNETGDILYRSLQADTLYMMTPVDLGSDLRKEAVPPGIKLVSLIKYPDNEAAFYLLTKDQSSEKIKR